jgi:hypothetical protein
MNPDELKKLIDTTFDQISLIKWWHFLLLMLLSAIGAYIGTYLREKGKNVATKEDIGRITDEIEKVKSIYAKEIENVREKQQLKLAAIEKRLECHQKAYALWRNLVWNVHNSDEIGKSVLECQEWWNNNCLFLSPKARESFLNAVFCAANHKDFLQDRSNIKLITDNWAKIMAAGKDISESVDLPSLVDYEDKFITRKEPHKMVVVKPPDQ